MMREAATGSMCGACALLTMTLADAIDKDEVTGWPMLTDITTALMFSDALE